MKVNPDVENVYTKTQNQRKHSEKLPKNEKIQPSSSCVASPEIWGGAKNFGGTKMFDFRQNFQKTKKYNHLQVA